MTLDLTPRPGRQYIFRTRRCRQRIAQALGAGQEPVRVAAVERLPLVEVTALARDPALAGLVEHYRALEELDPAERRARLVAAAAAMLERLVATGDLRAVAFVLHEEGQGRDPAAELADAVWCGVERSRERVVAGPRTLPDHHAPRRPAARPVGPWAFCAAVQPDAATAADLAMVEADAVPCRLRRMAADLRRLLTADLEREGTAGAGVVAAGRAAEAARLGRALHDRAAQAMAAAGALERLRDGAEPPPPHLGAAPRSEREIAGPGLAPAAGARSRPARDPPGCR